MNLLVLAATPGEKVENSFLLPHDINEVIWGGSAFLIVMTLIIWKGGPAIKSAWNGRIDRIAGELAAAEESRATSEAALAEVEGRIANADQERNRIRVEAQQVAASTTEQIAARAQSDGAAARERGLADISAGQSQAEADLQSEIAALAMGAAEVVVARNLDAATQTDLIEAYINNVGSQGVEA